MGGMNWSGLPIRAENAKKPLGGRAGPGRGLCVGGVGKAVSANIKEKQWKARRGWSWAGQKKEKKRGRGDCLTCEQRRDQSILLGQIT